MGNGVPTSTATRLLSQPDGQVQLVQDGNVPTLVSKGHVGMSAESTSKVGRSDRWQQKGWHAAAPRSPASSQDQISVSSSPTQKYANHAARQRSLSPLRTAEYLASQTALTPKKEVSYAMPLDASTVWSPPPLPPPESLPSARTVRAHSDVKPPLPPPLWVTASQSPRHAGSSPHRWSPQSDATTNHRKTRARDFTLGQWSEGSAEESSVRASAEMKDHLSRALKASLHDAARHFRQGSCHHGFLNESSMMCGHDACCEEQKYCSVKIAEQMLGFVAQMAITPCRCYKHVAEAGVQCAVDVRDAQTQRSDSKLPLLRDAAVECTLSNLPDREIIYEEKIVFKEVPVEKIVVREVPVIEERIVVKEVPKIEEKIVIKEVPVEKIVIKEVPVVEEKIVVQEVPVYPPPKPAVDASTQAIYRPNWQVVIQSPPEGLYSNSLQDVRELDSGYRGHPRGSALVQGPTTRVQTNPTSVESDVPATLQNLLLDEVSLGVRWRPGEWQDSQSFSRTAVAREEVVGYEWRWQTLSSLTNICVSSAAAWFGMPAAPSKDRDLDSRVAVTHHSHYRIGSQEEDIAAEYGTLYDNSIAADKVIKHEKATKQVLGSVGGSFHDEYGDDYGMS